MEKMWIVALCALAMLDCKILGSPVKENDQEFTMTIVHTNDMHARFEQTSRLSSACPPQDVKAGKCYGGFARIATLIRQARKSKTPTLFLNAGDTYQGSVWYNIYKWKIVSKFLNILAPDAISLGNHEFDDGVDGLIPFIEEANYPIVTANLDLSQQPNLRKTKLLNSTVLLVNGNKIGIIGYLTPETKTISTTENVIFRDEVECVREEAKKLKEQGINILIALGHSGFDVDKKIAKEVEDIDLVIGGHTNTFLYTGEQPDVEVPEGLYPTEIVQSNGRKVYVVQAYAYTKYLGNFTVQFDRMGEVTKIKGNPILVDNKIEQAKDILAELDQMREAVDNISLAVIGSTRVLLNGDNKVCRNQECNMGNIITDSMIDYNVKEYLHKNAWTDAAIAVHNSGAIRTSITRDNNDEISMGDVLSVLPFHNTVMKVTMTGDTILAMLERSVYRLQTNSTANLYGEFLQFSGLQVTYNPRRPQNSKVVSVQVQCAQCQIPAYSELKRNETYKVLLPDFMYNGGDGFSMLKDLEAYPLGVSTADTLVEYLKSYSPVYPAVEWRIQYVESNVKPYTNHGSKLDSIRITILLSIISWLWVR